MLTLRDLNMALLGAWVKRFIRDEDKNLALSDKKKIHKQCNQHFLRTYYTVLYFLEKG